MPGSTPNRFRRGLRRFLLGSGPLKRTSDRIQLAGRLLVVLALLAAVPVAVLVAGIARSHMEAAAATRAAGSHQARAVVLADAPSPPPTADGAPPPNPMAPAGSGPDPSASTAAVRAEVQWPAPDGAERRAAVLVPAGTAVGATVPVRVDRSGNLTAAPPDDTIIRDNAVAVGLAIAAGLPLVVWTLHTGLRVLLDVSRTRRWGREWERVDREWRAHQS